MLAAASIGAVIAGLYGIVHDQITFTLSPEYFTHLKFEQFSYADFNLAPRLFVAIIGVLATWWVGFIAGWFFARILLPHVSGPAAIAIIGRSFAMMIACSSAFGFAGYILASVGWYSQPDWEAAAGMLAITDLPSFVKVGYIHYGSYLGGLSGLILALLYCKRRTKPRQPDEPSPD